jgi:hypothetical protein
VRRSTANGTYLIQLAATVLHITKQLILVRQINNNQIQIILFLVVPQVLMM